MKKIFSEFVRHFFSNPILPLLVIVSSVLAMFFTSDGQSERLKSNGVEYVRTSTPISVISDSESTTSLASASASTSTAASQSSTTAFTLTVVSATATTTTEVPRTEAEKAAEEDSNTEGSTTETTSSEDNPDSRPERVPVSDYKVYVGADSSNSSYYQERLTILGDSIAYGFNAYGYIPYEHNIAKESMALWNMNKYTFDLGGGSMGAVDAAVYLDSPLIYISIGMNDILGTTPESYANQIYGIAQQLVDRIPDTTVVIGAITPVSANNYYTTNDTINNFNNTARSTVDSYGSSQILFFDANAILKDPNTGALASNVSGGDGLHITGSSYGYLLNALFNMLDNYDVKTRIETHDSKYE